MIRLSPELKLRLKLYAVRQNKTISAVVTEAIRDYLNAHKLNPSKDDQL
jgi:predicted DNA-binding protein